MGKSYLEDFWLDNARFSETKHLVSERSNRDVDSTTFSGIVVSHRILLSVLLIAFVVADANAQNRFHRRRGALLGGLAGAALGVAIGDKGDNETAGALIGGAVGAVAGGTIGNQKDQRIEQYHRNAHQSNLYRQQIAEQQAQVDWQAQQLAQQQTQRQLEQRQAMNRAAVAVSMDDVLTMVGRGLGESTIVQYVQTNGVRERLAVSDIIRLHEQGVSEPIINAMQTAPVAPVVFADPTTGVPVQDYPMTIQPPSYGSSIVVPVEPAPAGPMINHSRPYVFPPANGR